MRMMTAFVSSYRPGTWMMGCLAGPKHAVLHALSIIEDLGPSLGIFINLSKCELFSQSDISMFPHVMKASHVPHLDILGTPIGDYLYCTGFFAAKCVEFTKLLSKLEYRSSGGF